MQPSTTGQAIAFWALAALIIVSAIGVVRLRSIVRSALCLLPCFLGVAGLYLLLHAEFVFAMQLLVYAGGIMVLILFAIMLLQRSTDRELRHHDEHRGLSLLVCASFAALLCGVVLSTTWPISAAALPSPTGDGPDTITQTGISFLSQYIVPFEVISVLLLVAMIGAIIIARTREPDD